jgi:DNA (cytosine-5)-methyltransferase 1
MRHGSLFSGIGGFDLASEWMGWENVFHCEWNPFGQKVLNYYWPNAITYHDITKTDFTIHRGRIDIITGGFPCQPYSSAGKRLGKEDERHLWPEMLRAIREIQPTWVVGENVRGLTNWNGGLVFDEVQSELEAQGYEVTPFLLPACAVNAPHRRDRIWFIAYSKSNDAKRIREFNNNKWENNKEKRSGFWNEFTSNGSESNASDSSSLGFCEHSSGEELFSEAFGTQLGMDKQNAKHSYCIGQERRSDKKNGQTSIRNFFGESNAWFNKRNTWENFPTVAPICNGDDGISDRLDSITFSKWRNESIKAGGNAIVPQVVYQIFKAIEQYNQLDKQLSI